MAEPTPNADISALVATVQTLSNEVNKLKGNIYTSTPLISLTNIQVNPKSESCTTSMATT